MMLSPCLLSGLRQYVDQYKPNLWLFPGDPPEKPLSRQAVHLICKRAARATGIRKRVSAHAFRHAFATHLMEAGTNIRVIQLLLGHRSLRSTEIYTHVAGHYLHDTPSPLDSLSAAEKVPVEIL